MALWNIGARQTSGTDIGAIQYDLFARTWISTGSTDLNNSANWTGSGALLTTDNLYFTGVSTVDSALTANLEVNSITVEPGFTGGLAFVGYTTTLDGTSQQGYALYCSGTANRHFGNGLIIKGNSATVVLEGGSGNFIGTSCALRWDGSDGTLIDNHLTNFASWRIVNGLTCTGSMGSKVGVSTLDTTNVYLDASAYFRNNSVIYYDQYYSNNFLGFGGANTFNGSGFNFFRAAANSIIPRIPAITYTGTGPFYITDTTTITDWTTQLTGKLNLDNTAELHIYTTSNGSRGCFDTNGYDMTCGNIYPGGDASSSMSILYKSGKHSWGSYDGSRYNSSNVIQDFSSSNVTCNGDWTHGSNHSIIHSSDNIIFTGAFGSKAEYNIVSNNKSFLDATVNCSSVSKIIRARDNFSCRNFSTAVNLGRWTNYDSTLSISGNGYFATRTHDLGRALIFTGNNAVARFDSTIVTMDSTTAVFFNGNGSQFNSWKSWSIERLTVNGSDLTTGVDGATGTITILHSTATPLLNLGVNTAFVSNQPLVIQVGGVANYNAFSFGSGYAFRGTGSVRFIGGTGNLNISVNYTGSGDWTNEMAPGSACFFQPSSFNSSFNSSNLNSSIRSNSTLTFTGNSKYFSLNSIDGTDCTLRWNGQDGTFTTPAVQLNSLILGSNSQLRLNAVSGTLNFISTGIPLTMNNDSTLIINRSVYFRTISAALHSIGLRCNILNPAGLFYFSAVGNGTATFPTFNFPLTVNVTGSYSLGGSYGVRWTGNTNCTTLNVFAENACSRDATFDFNDYNIQCTSFNAGSYDTIYTEPTRPTLFNFGDGTHTFGTYSSLEFGRYFTHNLENSLILCNGNWTFPENPWSLINPQNSYVKILGTSTISMGNTLPGRFNDLEFDASSNTVTIIRGVLRARNLWVKSGGWTNTSTILSGNLTTDTTRACNLGSEMTFTGNSAVARFNSMGTQSGNPALNWQGNDGTWWDNVGLTMGGLTVYDGSSFNIAYGTAKTVFYTTPGSGIRPNSLKLNANSRLTVDASAQFYQYSIFAPVGGAVVYDCTSPYTLNGTGPIELKLLSSNSRPEICPALTYSGSGLFSVIIGPSTASDLYYFTGPLSFGKSLIISTPGNSSSTVRFYGPSITFPNNDSTFLNDLFPGTTLFNTYDASNCSLIYYGKRCAFTENYNSKTFKQLNLKPDATVTITGTQIPTFRTGGLNQPLVLDSGSNLILKNSVNFYLNSSGDFYSIAGNLG